MSSRASRAKAARAQALRVRNTHRVPGKPVSQAEVLRYARPSHNACKARTGKPAGVVFYPKTGSYHYCKCATEGMIAEHPEVILMADGSAWWPRDEDDEPQAQGDGHGEQDDEGTGGDDGDPSGP